MRRVRLWMKLGGFLIVGIVAAGVLAPRLALADRGPDPSGASTGAAIDVPAATAGAPNLL